MNHAFNAVTRCVLFALSELFEEIQSADWVVAGTEGPTTLLIPELRRTYGLQDLFSKA